MQAFPKKKRIKAKLTPAKVQPFFNAAIRRRDGDCVMTHSGHSGPLEASHFFTVKANGAMRFYPPCAHTQCTRHHKSEFHEDNPIPYVNWMGENVPEMDFMLAYRKVPVHYSQDDLRYIESECKQDRLEEVQTFIESKIKDACERMGRTFNKGEK
jgi:hypothetical protein